MNATTVPSLSGENLCPICRNTDFISHELGRVCPACGYVDEMPVLENRPAHYQDRNAKLLAQNSPRYAPTQLGRTHERRDHFRRLNHLQNTCTDDYCHVARIQFKKFLSLLDLQIRSEDLLIIFRKIYDKLPKYSRSKNIARLCFTILYKFAHTSHCLDLPKMCAQCEIPISKISNVLKNILPFSDLFPDNDFDAIYRMWGRVQIKYGLTTDDIAYMKSMITSANIFGETNAIRAAKTFTLYLKAHQLTEFFTVFNKSKITGWIPLLQRLASRTWARTQSRKVRQINCSQIANDFKVSESQIYRCYLTETWLKGTIVRVPKDHVVRIASLRIPEALFDVYFKKHQKTRTVRHISNFKAEKCSVVELDYATKCVSSINGRVTSKLSCKSNRRIPRCSPLQSPYSFNSVHFIIAGQIATTSSSSFERIYSMMPMICSGIFPPPVVGMCCGDPG